MKIPALAGICVVCRIFRRTFARLGLGLVVRQGFSAAFFCFQIAFCRFRGGLCREPLRLKPGAEGGAGTGVAREDGTGGAAGCVRERNRGRLRGAAGIYCAGRERCRAGLTLF